MRMKLEENTKMNFRSSYSVSRDSLILCGLIAIGISSVFFLLVQTFPKQMNYIDLLLGGIEALVGAITLFFNNGDYKVLKILGGLFLLLNVLLILKKLNVSGVHGQFLE